MGNCLSKEPEGRKLGTSEKSTTTQPNPIKTNKPIKVSSKGQTLSSEKNENLLPPREAAKLAAERRAQAQNEKGGKLHEQLQKERAKTTQQHMKELSEKKALEYNQRLIYD